MAIRLNLLLASSAALFFVAGTGLLFAPEEISVAAGGRNVRELTAVLQVLGSALFGFGMLNWMNRYSVTAGVLGRPLLLANFAHAGSAALLLARVAFDPPWTPILAIPAVAYAMLGIAFGVKVIGPMRPR